MKRGGDELLIEFTCVQARNYSMQLPSRRREIVREGSGSKLGSRRSEYRLPSGFVTIVQSREVPRCVCYRTTNWLAQEESNVETLVASCSTRGSGPGGPSIMLYAGTSKCLFHPRLDVACGLATNCGQF